MDVCPDILPKIDTLVLMYESSQQMQDDTQEALSRIARATIAEREAIKMKETLGGDLTQAVKLQVSGLSLFKYVYFMLISMCYLYFT